MSGLALVPFIILQFFCLPSSSSVNWYLYSVVVVCGTFVVAFVVDGVVLV